MCARLPRGRTRSTGSGRSRIGLLALLLLVGGALVQACTNQTSGGGPSFPAGQTGTADFPEAIIVRVGVNANAIELNRKAGITVLVTNFNGHPLEGRHVQMSTTFGRLDQVDGFTDVDGKFVTFLFCDPDSGAGSATVTAFVQGAVGQNTVTCGVTAPPAGGTASGGGGGGTGTPTTGVRPTQAKK
jgi:hypothetical protein